MRLHGGQHGPGGVPGRDGRAAPEPALHQDRVRHPGEGRSERCPHAPLRQPAPAGPACELFISKLENVRKPKTLNPIVFVTPEKVARSDALMRLFDNLHQQGLS